MTNFMTKKTIGIIGGMGPLATADLFQKIIQNTCASCDQEHLRILIDNNTEIPDRTHAILHSGSDPVPQLTKSARSLQQMGADLLVMPCNTAHFFHNSIQAAVTIPVLHMIKLTCLALQKKGITKAGLLATDGTIQSGIYQPYFAASGIELLMPDANGQKAIMDMIYCGVKAGVTEYNTASVRSAMDNLLLQGAQTLILGCTELPLAMKMYGLKYPCCDPTLELARGAIRAAGGVCLDERLPVLQNEKNP